MMIYTVNSPRKDTLLMMEGQTDRQIDRQLTEINIDRQTDIQIDRQTGNR